MVSITRDRMQELFASITPEMALLVARCEASVDNAEDLYAAVVDLRAYKTEADADYAYRTAHAPELHALNRILGEYRSKQRVHAGMSVDESDACRKSRTAKNNRKRKRKRERLAAEQKASEIKPPVISPSDFGPNQAIQRLMHQRSSAGERVRGVG